MTIPKSWDQELSPYKVSKLVAEKFDMFDKILQNATAVCEARTLEINKAISETAKQRDESQRIFSQWNGECESFTNDVEITLNKLSAADIVSGQEKEKLSGEEKELLVEFTHWEKEQLNQTQAGKENNDEKR